MNAVEIEEAVSDLALQPFDAFNFPYQFLTTFGNKDTAIARLRSGNTNKSNIDDGVLQSNNIHIATCPVGQVGETLNALRESPATRKFKAKFILATDGDTLEQAEIEFENAGGETYICGNPPYLGSTWQDAQQKADLEAVFAKHTKNWKSPDFVAGWFMKAAEYGTQTNAAAAFVSTNSICQGQQVPILWPAIFSTGHEIAFAYTSFKWANLASHNAGVTVVIVGIKNNPGLTRRLYAVSTDSDQLAVKDVSTINAYLVPGANVTIEKSVNPICGQADLTTCAENILLAREAHFPATIADLYDPDNMPENLRHAHERNDEVLERIYIGRRFKNDTERLEKLFELYTRMTAVATPGAKQPTRGKKA